jgi:hypothetical protein
MAAGRTANLILCFVPSIDKGSTAGLEGNSCAEAQTSVSTYSVTAPCMIYRLQVHSYTDGIISSN